jgi:hypothetical protein
MHSRLKALASASVALSLIIAPTAASAAQSSPAQPVSPLVAVSAYGSPASAQVVAPQVSAATAATSAAAMAQDPDYAGGHMGWDLGTYILLAIGLAALIGGIITLFNDGGNVDTTPISPA